MLSQLIENWDNIPSNHQNISNLNSFLDDFERYKESDEYLSKKDEVIEEIKGINDMVYSLNNNAIYALPSIDVTELEEAALENDNKRSYNQLFRKVQSMTVDINKKIISITFNKFIYTKMLNFYYKPPSLYKMYNFFHLFVTFLLKNHTFISI